MDEERNARVLAILKEAKPHARQYRELKGKPLGITGEIAEYAAARLLRLELAPARTAGFDAIERTVSKFKSIGDFGGVVKKA
ncbi:MAG: hypothetical protein LC624_01640 [Halobacteriales archaeon]|nr:hypothetical protein [Halobacteriales archaeon]